MAQQKLTKEEEQLENLTKKEKKQQELNRRAADLVSQKEEKRALRRKKDIEKRNAVWYDPNFDKRFSRISKKYVGSYFIGYFLFDCLACVPVLFFELTHGFTTDPDRVNEHIHTHQYYLFVFFKLFKFLMLPRLMQSLNFLEAILKQAFVKDTFVVQLIMSYTKAGAAFILMVHISTCAWLWVGNIPDEWMDHLSDQSKREDLRSLYVASMYFITTTMTTIGYGDISAFGKGEISMIMVMLTQFFGLLGFSIVKMVVFNQQRLYTLPEVVKKIQDDVEETLFRIDKIRETSQITNYMYDEAINYIGVIQSFSICTSFKDHRFWRDLSPQLQQRLFNSVLANTVNRFEFFFNDYNLNVHAPPLLVQSIVVEMNAHLIRKNDYLIKKDQYVDFLYFLYVGVAHLHGFPEINGKTYRVNVATLKKGSWFGDYQIMVNVPSSWDLMAGGDHEFDNTKKPKGMPKEHILVYTVHKDSLRKIMDRYPNFRSFLITRALTRRTYF